MGKMQRQKGAAGEREVFKILNDELGLDLKRNLDQYQGTDSDLHFQGFCVEIKRQEVLSLRSWWAQVVTVAEKHDEVPALIYRKSRQPWRVVTPFAVFSPLFVEMVGKDKIAHPAWVTDFDYSMTTLLDPMFTAILRELLVSETAYAMAEKGIDITH